MKKYLVRTIALGLLAALTVLGQVPPPKPSIVPGFGSPPQPVPPPQQAPPQPDAAKPAPQAAQPAAAPQGTQTASAITAPGGFNLQNASLTEVIDILARQLKINYILDPRVKGGVSLNTYGEMRQLDSRSLLDMILKINGYAMVQVGDIYRIVPMSEVPRLPIRPLLNGKDFAENDQVQLNLVFLKYATVDELAKVLEPFIGENAKTWAYAPANLLLILDSARSMKRTMELISLFDSDSFASQRVRLFEVKNGRPSDLAKDLDAVLKSISLNEKASPIRLMPIDRINTIVAVAANPGAFEELEKWLRKLDLEVKVTAGAVDNFVYRVKYAQADMLAMAITMLYGGMPMGMGMMGGMGMGGFGGYGGRGMMGGGMYGGGGGMYGGGGGMYGGGGGMYGGGMYGGGMYGGGGAGAMGQYGPSGYVPTSSGGLAPPVQTGGIAGGVATPMIGGSPDLTGQYMGMGIGQGPNGQRIPRIIPNPMDNTLLIQATTVEYEGILKLLKDLDVPPRQVLIEAKIYEVSLTGAFANGVAAFLQKRGSGSSNAPTLETKSVVGQLASGAVSLSAGALVGQSRELLAFLSTQEATSRSKVIGAPSIIATDSISASINVGTEVPTLTAQAVTGAQSNGSSLFANNISNRNSGVTLSIVARVTPAGIVTLVINQEVSSPIQPKAGEIQSPSFSKRTIQTQVTVQDGDTIAIAGIINESTSEASAGIPILHRLPFVGYAFGSKSVSHERTELIIFMTPRVIYDTNEIQEASEELKSRLNKLKKIVKE